MLSKLLLHHQLLILLAHSLSQKQGIYILGIGQYDDWYVYVDGVYTDGGLTDFIGTRKLSQISMYTWNDRWFCK